MLNVIGESGGLNLPDPVCSGADIEDIKKLADNIYIHDDLKEYIVKIAQKTREHASVQMGVSPRATLWLMRSARVHAFIEGRDHVLPDDIKDLAEFVFAHRMITYSGRDIASKRSLIREILGTVEVPSEEWSRK
jgi:MoxR-like ATPase